jgi:hypothetical protein
VEGEGLVRGVLVNGCIMTLGDGYGYDMVLNALGGEYGLGFCCSLGLLLLYVSVVTNRFLHKQTPASAPSLLDV